MTRPRALCVTSPNWLGTVHSPRLLHQAGFEVTLLAHPRSFAARSRFVERLIAASWDPAVNVEVLRKHLAGEPRPYDWIVLADDPTLMEALRRRAEPWTAACLPTDPAGLGAELLLSKARFMEEAQSRGLPIPPSRLAASREALVEAAEALGYPVIVKPVQGSSGRGVFVARSADEMRESARAAVAGAFVVQRFVTGQVGGTLALFDHGAPRAWLSSYKLRVNPAPYGPSSARKRVHLPDSREVLAGFGRMLGVHGIVSFDWILPEGGGQAMILECNGRPVAWLNMVREVGLDLPGAIREMRAGAPASIAAPETPGEEVALFPQDAVRAIAESDWKRLARWVFAPPGPLPWDEPRLFAAHLRFLAVRLVKKAFPSIRRAS